MRFGDSWLFVSLHQPWSRGSSGTRMKSDTGADEVGSATLVVTSALLVVTRSY